MEMTTDRIYAIVEQHLPRFVPSESLVELEGGNLNHVWRLEGEERSLIIKFAPPHIAADPEQPLSSSRLAFEARALDLFKPEQPLHRLAESKIRPPALLYFEPELPLLVMEDAGALPGLDDWVNGREQNQQEGTLAATLGAFIGKLHKQTYQSTEIRSRFNNRPIQETRNDVQYRPAADYVAEILPDESERLRKRAESLGEKLLGPGRTLVMGDLWPPSVLVTDTGNLRIIDWEFAHYGRPLQDLGHFAAHCWMQAHAAGAETGTGSHARRWHRLWQSFWEAYRRSTGNLFPELIDRPERDEMSVHIGAEILMRTAGPFKSGYLYQEYGNDHPLIKDAVGKAVDISGTDPSEIWKMLPAIG
ncbi:MAG: phosphotransferase [Balneolaceae bacterium]|nr:phosphotransferase [Balneolaceae bacterium]